VIEFIKQTLPIYKIPSQALWRAFELAKLKEIRDRDGFITPVLEIGCGDGAFGALLFESIDDGIDININSINYCRQHNRVYKHVAQMDARAVKFGENKYQTIFANCVLEHISNLNRVLSEGYRLLKPGGKFIATVPLINMNHSLLFRSRWYAELRRKQLNHANLLSSHEWIERFNRAGFNEIFVYGYLPSKICRYWDLLDLPFCLGYRKYSAYGAISLLWRVIPDGLKKAYLRRMSKFLSRFKWDENHGMCAIVLIAQKAKINEDRSYWT
jgi:SAM-dependent methyltransferase